MEPNPDQSGELSVLYGGNESISPQDILLTGVSEGLIVQLEYFNIWH